MDRRSSSKRISGGRRGLADLAVGALLFIQSAAAFEPIIQLIVATPSKPVISGNTHLPDDTPLMVVVQVAREDAANPGHILYPFMGERPVVVHGHRFPAGPFSIDGSPYDRGTYIASVVISNLALPNSVKPILGDMGQKIGGPNVKVGPLDMPYFEVRQTFEVR
jgi:hypothetical protein